MFGMSWGEIAIILAVGMFVLGPERIPVAVKWVGSTLRTVRTMAAGAQEQLRGEFGPELDELRRQIADLQSLKEIQELRSLRDLNPRTMITKNILGEEFSGGVKGMLGLDGLSDMMKSTGSGVAEESPAVDFSKPPAVTEPTVTGPAVTEPFAVQPVQVNEPARDHTVDHSVDHPAQVDEPAAVDTQKGAVHIEGSDHIDGVDPSEPSPEYAAPRHAAPTTFDVDAT